jgi:hypothetical protein
MKVFLSHSKNDADIVNLYEKELATHGINLLIAEHNHDLTKNSITEKIKDMINEVDLGIVLLTAEGFNSSFVQQEIGYLESKNMPYLQIVEEGLEQKIAGFNFGKDYLSINKKHPDASLEKVKKTLIENYNLMQVESRQENFKTTAEGEKATQPNNRNINYETIVIKENQKDKELIILAGFVMLSMLLITIALFAAKNQ